MVFLSLKTEEPSNDIRVTDRPLYCVSYKRYLRIFYLPTYLFTYYRLASNVINVYYQGVSSKS